MESTAKASLRPAARAGILLLAAAVLPAAAGCSYLKWRKTRSEGLHELKKHPDLLLEKEILPEDCFVLIGRPDYGAQPRRPLLVAAFADSSPAHELVGSRQVAPEIGEYGILLPAASYDLVVFADLNGDGYYTTEEAVGRSSDPVRVAADRTSEGIFVPAAPIAIDTSHPTSGETAIRVKVVPKEFVVESVADPVFAPEYGEMGVYEPTQFLARVQRVIFSVGEPDPKKAQVILVHGIDGTPRDFQDLIPSLDPSRYHVWLFYYPSGLPLENLGKILALAVRRISEMLPKETPIAVVAHSMGGLVGRAAVNELCAPGRPRYLRLYASFDTPYGGVESAAGAVKRGTELVPSWIDVAAGSPFLTRLHSRPLPADLPFHLFFGWGLPDHHGPRPAGDGTIALASQLDPRAQAVATGMSGYGDTHVGILSDREALAELSRVLDAACGTDAHSPAAAR